MGRHLPYGITQCYLPPDTSERTPPNPSHAGWYSIYLPRRDGRLSWPSWLDSAPAGSRTSDLSITSPMPNRCTTKTTKLPWLHLQQEKLGETTVVRWHHRTVTKCLTWQVMRSQHSPTAHDALVCSWQVVALQHVLVQSCIIIQHSLCH